MTSPLSTTPSKTNAPLLSMGGPLGLTGNNPWGDARNWKWTPPDPQAVAEYQSLECDRLLHPKSPLGYWKRWQLSTASRSAQNAFEVSKGLFIIAGVAGGLASVPVVAFMATEIITHKSHTPVILVDSKAVIPLAALMLSGIACTAGILNTLGAGILTVLKRFTPAQDIVNFGRCQSLEYEARPSWVYQSGGEANEGEKSQMLALPNDIGLGTTAAADAALTQKGWGLVDIAMGIAISTTIAAFVPPVASFPAGVATCHAVARAF